MIDMKSIFPLNFYSTCSHVVCVCLWAAISIIHPPLSSIHNESSTREKILIQYLFTPSMTLVWINSRVSFLFMSHSTLKEEDKKFNWLSSSVSVKKSLNVNRIRDSQVLISLQLHQYLHNCHFIIRTQNLSSFKNYINCLKVYHYEHR